jgi:hypothetical protein
MDLAAWFGSHDVFSTGEAAHIFGSGPVGRTGPHAAPRVVVVRHRTVVQHRAATGNRLLFAVCCVGVGPTTHWHCHQSTPSLMTYLLLTPSA